ncbi:hypothetical protein PtA15_9A645 [Puccinia triticina]|uniref:Uncharacterized protein n=2 Tax=Puccinia triticina TaxID=208348 RepID=A0ABY7CUD8_9BASI|nr:uncharacterized protein PtA15_9A645 [Puccinia triticina]WAQ88518.1 hypothetical protein PtA15_9A645 [Puccinia triticina]WAR60698.1 hypothetical protein PtB15_9B637 [Puccinia triticina]
MAVQSNYLKSRLWDMETKQGKEYRQGRNGQKAMSSRRLSGAEAKINLMKSDWREITSNVLLLRIWAHDELEHVSGCVKEVIKLYDYLGIRTEELASALSAAHRLRSEISQERSRPLTGIESGPLKSDVSSIELLPFEDTWSGLEERLIEPNDILNDNKEVKAQLLENMLMLAVYIAKHEVISTDFLERIRLFQPKYLSELLQFYLKLKQWNSKHVLDDLDWNTVFPTLECLTTHKATRPFHAPIRGM